MTAVELRITGEVSEKYEYVDRQLLIFLPANAVVISIICQV
jgi:hypothetical protein